MDAQFFLKNLIIQNFATFRNQNIQFRTGLNSIIGETGSGKSLVLDALQLILGGRADKKVVRRETDYALIEASFHCEDPAIISYLESEGFPIEGKEIIIKRLIYKSGVTKNYINHLTCTVTFLSLFSRRFIDMVGQFENQKLLSEPYQLHLLDNYSKNFEALAHYQKNLKEYKQLKKEQEELIHSKTSREQRLDYLNFQLQEIEKLNPSSQEEEGLLKKKTFLANFEKTQKLCFQVREVLDGDDSQRGILSHLSYLSHLFTKNADIFADQLEMVSAIDDQIQTLESQINEKVDQDFNIEDLEEVLNRLDHYQKLKKKFGGSVETILQTQVEFMREKSQLDELEINLDGIEGRLKKLDKTLNDLAQKLHDVRLLEAKKFSKALTEKVRGLKMNGATIKIEVEKIEEYNDTGLSRVFFNAETNPGEGFFKIKDIASGGELSRILLALRQILSSHDSISIFLFDEIDTGIGGETAISIGKALLEVAFQGQVIAITHLPQIAQFSDSLIIVNKDISTDSKEERTESTVKEILGKNIQREVKAMAQLT